MRTPSGCAANDHIAAILAQLLGAPIHNSLDIHLTPVHLQNGLLDLQQYLDDHGRRSITNQYPGCPRIQLRKKVTHG